MRYYATRNLIYCLRHRPFLTMVSAMFWMFVILTVNNMMNPPKPETVAPTTTYTEEQVQFGRWLMNEYEQPVEETYVPDSNPTDERPSWEM